MPTTHKLSSHQLELLQKAFELKREDPLTRQSYFGELSTQEKEAFKAFLSLPSVSTYDYNAVEKSVHLIIFGVDDPLLTVTRGCPDIVGQTETHTVCGMLFTSVPITCPIMGKIKRTSWTTYLTKEFWKELEPIVS